MTTHLKGSLSATRCGHCEAQSTITTKRELVDCADCLSPRRPGF